MKNFQIILELARVSNLPTAWTNVLAAWLLAGGARGAELVWMLFGAALLYSGGMILNDAADARWDAQHRRERAIPSGRISARAAWWLASVMLVLGSVACLFAGAHGWWVLALVMAIVLYDLHHKHWAGSVVVMGACRTLLYVMAASPIQVTGEVWCWGLLLGIYIVALTTIARGEARGSFPPGLRWACVAMLLLPAVWQLCAGVTWIKVLLLLAQVGLVFFSLVKMKQGGPKIGDAVGWLLAGIPLVDAMALSATQPNVALIFLCLPPLLRLWQRWVAAT
jgi:hypothetical protein